MPEDVVFQIPKYGARLDLTTAVPRIEPIKAKPWKKEPVYLRIDKPQAKFSIVNEKEKIILEVTKVPEIILTLLELKQFADITVGVTKLPATLTTGLTPPENMVLRNKIQRLVDSVCRNLGIQPPTVEVPKYEVFMQLVEMIPTKAVYKRDLCFLPSPFQPLRCIGPAILFNPKEIPPSATTIAHEIIHHKDYDYFVEKVKKLMEKFPFRPEQARVVMEAEANYRARKLVREKGLAEAWKRILKNI